MKSISIPFNESQAFELTNSRRQRFLVWCEPAKTRLEIYLALNNRKALLQTMALIPSGEPENRVLLDFLFDAEAVFVGSKGTVQSIQLLTVAEQKRKKYLNIDGYPFVLLASPGFSKQFSLEEGRSKIRVPSRLRFSLNKPSRKSVNPEDLTTGDVLEHILKQKEGHGLRSKIPAYYVWYHDLLFLVDTMSFPGYAASLSQRQITTELIPKLEALGIKPIVKEAVYRRQFLSNPGLISKEDTWYGMENRGKFVTTNSFLDWKVFMKRLERIQETGR